MIVTQVTFTRKCNTGNFESFDMSATAQVAADEDAHAAAVALQSYVDSLCNERVQMARRPTGSGPAKQDAGELPF